MREAARRVLTIPEAGVLAPLLLAVALFGFRNPAFLEPANAAAMLRGAAFIGVIAVGQTLLMVCGELDLSVGSVAGLCAIVCAWAMHDAHWSIAASIAAGLGAGAATGIVNGLVAVRLGLPAFIATLGMMYIARGLNYLLCKGYPVYPLPRAVSSFGRAEPLGISWSFVVFVCAVAAGDFFLRKTVWGRMVCATGGNREVARIAGIRTDAVRIACYATTGMLAGAAGMLSMAQLNVGQPEIGLGAELDVIASVVIGGVSLFGGLGTVAGSLIGLLIMTVVRSGLVMEGFNPHFQTVAIGVIMILAVGMDLLRRRARIG